MKKATSLMLALLFSAVMLMGEAIDASTRASAADLCCDALSGCGSDECCSGRGSANGCIMQCDSGTGIICPKSGGGGGGEEEILQ